MSFVVFFFQAEDGIRDYKVTGVQTCALPISRLPRPRRPREQAAQRKQVVVLPLVPHAVPPEAAEQVCEQAGGALDGAAREVLVLEPRCDRGERGVVPRLPVDRKSVV